MRLYLSSFRIGNHPEKLHDLLKGKVKTAIILNAMDFLEPKARSDDYEREEQRLVGIGLEPEEIDLRDYFNDKSGLKEKLLQYDLVWVRGGNVFILRRAFAYSHADNVIRELLDEDRVVYGGYSAGIDILTLSLKGMEFVDNPNIVPEGYKSEIIWDCLGIIPYAVAPHYKSDHPESADIDKTVQWYLDNHVLFKALRDGEVIIVNGDGEEF